MSKSSRFSLEDISRLPAKAQAEVQAQLYGGAPKPVQATGLMLEKLMAARKLLDSAEVPTEGRYLLKDGVMYGPSKKASPKPSCAQPRLRQDRTGLNKTEAAFFAYLKNKQPLLHHTAQEITLKIANGCRYTPDFVSWRVLPNGLVHISAYEVKGFMRDDAAVKIKVAARTFPFITFHLVTRRNGAWKIETILP
jgi:hypothetical protein